ncbi:unnamed protein product [Oppiella nova]|uniref:Uncharacterized protein n=1 Tax=Oppiella nova TaxID=334625 RepID=A0A7R9L9V2_9ACAR|nr:unnamed protein product [Oppiella nova]CAG2161293.1 unnamed protein product [Oppiella nova]
MRLLLNSALAVHTQSLSTVLHNMSGIDGKQDTDGIDGKQTRHSNDYSISYGHDFNECSTRAVAKSIALFCMAFSGTYLLQKSRAVARRHVFVLPTVVATVVGVEALRVCVSTCRQKFDK